MNSNSNSKILLLIPYIVFVCVQCLDNLVQDRGFQLLGFNLDSMYVGTQSYSYRLMSNSQSGWYSTTSDQIIIRTNPNTNSTVMDTLNNNTHNIICHNFRVDNYGNSYPYQLTFQYMLDNNVNRPIINITWNNQQVFFRRVRNNYIQSVTYTIYMKQNINKLCFQAWAERQAENIGVLIDNVVVAKQEVRNVMFWVYPRKDMVNYLQLVSNQTVNNGDQLQLFQSQSTLNISQVYYNLTSITIDGNNKLVFIIEIQQQYASQQCQPSITLPTHRNQNGQILTYIVNASKLPRYIYSMVQTQQIITQSHTYIIVLAEIYNICYRVIRIVGFSYLGLNWMGFYYIGLMLGFLDVKLIDGYTRKQMEELMNITVNRMGIKYFLEIGGKIPYQLGQQYINLNQSLPQPHIYSPSYSKFNITTSLYPLLYDNLLISLFNTLKIYIFYHLLFKNSKKMRKILNQIKNQKIIIQYISIFPITILVATNCWQHPAYITNTIGRYNRCIITLIPILCIILSLKIFISQWTTMQNNYRKVYKKNHSSNKIQINQKLRKYYRYKIVMTLIKCLTLVIIPSFIGLNFTYTTLLILLLMLIISIPLKLMILHLKPSFINFLQFLIKCTQICLPICYLLAQIISDIEYLDPETQIKLMNFLRYNSIVLLFVYVVGGGLQIGISVYNFCRGIMSIQFKITNCYKTKIKNQNQNQTQIQEDHEIKIDKQLQNISQHAQSQNNSQQAGIRIINQLRNKIEKKSAKTIKSQVISSSGEITNPFVSNKNAKDRLERQHLEQKLKQKEKQKQKQKQKQQTKNKKKLTKSNFKPQNQSKMTRVITMKNIQPLQLQEMRMRHKSSSQLQTKQNKDLRPTPIKKAREVSGNKQKSLKVISKVQIPNFNDDEGKQDVVQQNMMTSFEKQENFS